MERQIFLALIYISLAVTIGAQTSNPNSAQQGLSGVERVEHLIKMAQELSREDPVQGLSLAKEAFHLATRLKDTLHIILALDTIGRIHDATSNFEEAVKVYLQAIEIAEKNGIQKERAILYSHLGIVYAILGDRDKGLALCERSVSVAEQAEDPEILATALGHLGLVYIMRKQYDKALIHVQRTLAVNETLENQRGISGGLSNLGIIYRNQGQYSKALEVQQRALRIRQETGEKRAIAASQGNLGLVYANLKDYDQAMAHHLKALYIRREISDLRGAASSLVYIKDVLLAQGNYKQALLYYDRHIALRDSVFGEEQNQKIVRMEMQFDLKQKERENDFLRRSNRIQFIIFALVLSLIVVVSLFFYIHFQARAAHAEELQKRSRLEGINEMIVTYNHEMNQPLTVIQGMSQIISRTAQEKGQELKDVQMILEAVEKLVEILGKISDLRNAEYIESKEYIEGVQMIDID